MIFTAENILLIGAILIFCSILISKTGYRFGIPTLLLFLLVGMVFGSDGLGLQFNSALDAQFIGMMALSIILFTGGMDTKLQDIRPVLAQGILLSTIGVLMTTLLTGGFIYFLSPILLMLCSIITSFPSAKTGSVPIFSTKRIFSFSVNLSKISKSLQMFESSTPKHPHRGVLSLRMTRFG